MVAPNPSVTARIGLLTLSCVALLLAHVAYAADAKPVSDAAPAVVLKPAVPLEQATDIKAQPLAVLSKFPDAGPALAHYVADALTRQPGLVDAMLSIIDTTSPAQASAIGAGMVRAARALEARHPGYAEQLSEKVARSDNIWFKTTYEAMGPHYRAYRAFMDADVLPPRTYGNFADGSGAGVMSASWRVGPAPSELVNGAGVPVGDNTATPSQTCNAPLEAIRGRNCYGMIVAVVSSDAASNGAVSTSPTH